ncbi:MAG: TolC family protein [Spirochaetales bacterium]|nr:TolC family protein [Spirochaetales bacterium]
MNKRSNIVIICTILILFGFGFIPAVYSQSETITIEEAVSLSLKNNPSVESAHWEQLFYAAKAEEAGWKMFPSLSVAAGYQKLSDLPASSVPPGYNLPTDIFSFTANLQYPVFAGFRIREAAALADLQLETKQLTLESMKRALRFEVRRAYWEAVRASYNVQMLEKNLELSAVNRDLAAKYADQGTATVSEKLTADLRYKQADLDLGDARSIRRRAFLVLLSLIGQNGPELKLAGQAIGAVLPYTLSTTPDNDLIHEFGDNPDETGLITDALMKRPETRLSAVALKLAEHSQKLAEAVLYPTEALTGNFTYANPNQRVLVPSDPSEFTATWAVGVQVSYDFGGLPANLKESEAQDHGVNKSMADKEKQQNAVILDVRTCLLNLARAQRDFALTKEMVPQSSETLRVVQQKVDVGMASSADLLNAQLGLLRANFTVTNKQIDLQIAAADLARAVALEDIR